MEAIPGTTPTSLTMANSMGAAICRTSANPIAKVNASSIISIANGLGIVVGLVLIQIRGAILIATNASTNNVSALVIGIRTQFRP